MTASDLGGDGTPEHAWAAWLAAHPLAPMDLAPLLAASRIVVLAAHPDDEVLGVGGLCAGLARRGRPLHVVWATDGEASHPAAPAGLVADLPQRRRAESRQALERLGVRPAAQTHLGLPDGALAARSGELMEAVREVIGAEPADVAVLAPWRHDGHPDHEAVGVAAAAAAGDRLLEYPIWAWHWGTPASLPLPWQRARIWRLEPDQLAAKRAAISSFVTQVRPLSDGPGLGPVLSAGFLEHFTRPLEVLLT